MRKVDQTKEMEAATLCKKEGNPYFWVTLFLRFFGRLQATE